MSIADLPQTSPPPDDAVAPAPVSPPSPTEPSPAPDPAPASSRPAASLFAKWSSESTIAAWLLVVAGAALRIRWWLHWRSFWLDELYLAHSVLTRGFHKLLFTQLDFWQGAPAGFLALCRLCRDLLGPGERSLRLPSLLAGLVCLPLFYGLARRLLSVRASLLGLLLFVSLRPLVYYSGELKQYSTDLTACLAILYCATAVWQRPVWRNWLLLGGVGVAAIFFAFPAILVLAAVGIFLLIVRPRGIMPLLACGVVWAGLEWLNLRYFLAPLMHGEAHDGLMRFWVRNAGFPPRPPNLAIAWIYSAFRDCLSSYDTMYLNAAPLALFAAIIGLASMLRRCWPVALLLTAPLAAGIAAAFAHRYPFAQRLTLYIVPILVLFIAEGIDQIWGRMEIGQGGWTRSTAGLLVSLMIIAEPVHRAIHEFHFPPGREETKQIYDWLRRNWQTGDVLYLSLMADRSFDQYAPQTGLAGLRQLYPVPGDSRQLESSQQGMRDDPGFAKSVSNHVSTDPPAQGYVVWQPDCSTAPSGYLDHIDALFHPSVTRNFPRVHRVWVLFVHSWDNTGLDLETITRAELDRCASQSYGHSEEGAKVILYESK